MLAADMPASPTPLRRSPFRAAPRPPAEARGPGGCAALPPPVRQPLPRVAAGGQAEDPVVPEGFVRIDGTMRPAKVSGETWARVFPADYARVRRLAGRYFVEGRKPDEAVDMALGDIERESWAREPLAGFLAVLRPLFPDGWDDERDLPAPELAAAARAVWPTAEAHWRTILSDRDPGRAWFPVRRWLAPPGCCLVCGGPLGEADAWSGRGDGLHRGCKPVMAAIGPAYGRLVAAAAAETRDSQPPPFPPHAAPPDDDGGGDAGA